MKNFSRKLLLGIIILSITSPCLANPLTNLFSIFHRDLVINILYEDPKDLMEGSQVYLAEDPKGEKILIGSVKTISLIEPKTANIKITITKKYKEKIYETTRFVLMSGLFAEDSKSYIIAIPSLKPSNQTPLE